MERVGRMPHRCAPTLPPLRKRHPHAQSSLLSRWRRRCGGWASSGIDSSGFIRFKCLVCRKVPVYSSRLVFRRVESVVVCSRVCCLPVFYRAQVHWGRWNGRRIRRLRWLGAVFLILMNDGHSCQHIEGVGRQVEVIQTGRYYWMLSTKCIRECRLVWAGVNSHYLWLQRSHGGDCFWL